ncbi:bifunctional demethylmenaquinone methyltransferase/2-methoxy-6-polyprenyl-1,4-benzoquinol methylase UbiE [Kiritimatiellota bacterium B12222]|nr:bifunctional demethylmenaquinone methyltransferase/2-methoxy-6-polyprenyl-1,4-benzoquinol methylase UbiE [Kiritimatiellota bacterium B12222]
METPTSTSESPSRQDVWKMFDRIAGRYDFLNRSLSFGRDVSWRKRIRQHLPKDKPLMLVDLATGTADQILFLLEGDAEISQAVGYDLSEEMLEVGRGKIKERNLEKQVTLLTGDAMACPAEDDTADIVTISFGIRNVLDVPTALLDMKRILHEGGKLCILECSLPPNKVIRWGYLMYFRHVLPKLGGWVSGDAYAYNYLNKTVETFPCGDAFCQLMREAGFEQVQADAMTFGVATLYTAVKPVGDA